MKHGFYSYFFFKGTFPDTVHNVASVSTFYMSEQSLCRVSYQGTISLSSYRLSL